MKIWNEFLHTAEELREVRNTSARSLEIVASRSLTAALSELISSLRDWTRSWIEAESCLLKLNYTKFIRNSTCARSSSSKVYLQTLVWLRARVHLGDPFVGCLELAPERLDELRKP